MYSSIKPMGDQSLIIYFEKKIDPKNLQRITQFVHDFKEKNYAGVIDIVPAYQSIMIIYNPKYYKYEELRKKVENCLDSTALSPLSPPKIFEIPVCYGGRYGPDIENVAKYTSLPIEEIIRIHTKPKYLIYMLGFLPGFAYLGGMDARLRMPRLETPRLQIPEGSVGIADLQTGIYPVSSPGGWQLIGRTPLKLFSELRNPMVLYSPGDYLQFVPIDEKTFKEIEKQQKEGDFKIKFKEG